MTGNGTANAKVKPARSGARPMAISPWLTRVLWGQAGTKEA
jgi:hypothetical protein